MRSNDVKQRSKTTQTQNSKLAGTKDGPANIGIGRHAKARDRVAPVSRQERPRGTPLRCYLTVCLGDCAGHLGPLCLFGGGLVGLPPVIPVYVAPFRASLLMFSDLAAHTSTNAANRRWTDLTVERRR